MNTQFSDTLGHIHHTGKSLGQGGQGMVIRTKDPDLAIKIATNSTGDAPESDPKIIERRRRRYNAVRRMPVPKSSHITLPLVLLRDVPGYVMHLMSELTSMKALWPSASFTPEEIPEWLSTVNERSEKDAKVLLYYSLSGGLRRRLAISSRCASELARLHAQSLIYGDISVNNIYISPDLEAPNVWLIDADNISYEREKGGLCVCTRSFGAPELVQGISSCTPASDCYAFAVNTFKTLTLTHPFLGRAATSDDSDWADSELDGEERAYRGELPWIDDPDDDSNVEKSFALLRVLVLTPQLKKLFTETFCAGRTDPGRRPVIWHWVEALAKAADSTLACATCHMTFYADHAEETGHCPYCKAPAPSFIRIRSFRWVEAHTPMRQVWQFERELVPNTAIQIPARVFVPFDVATTGDKPMLSLKSEEDSYLIEIVSETACEMNLIAENIPGENFATLRRTNILPKSCTQFKILHKSKFPYVVEFSIHQR